MDEIWKDIPGFDGRYQASNLGNIRSMYHGRGPRKTPLERRQRLDKYGYLVVSLVTPGGRNVLASSARIICSAFNGLAPEGYDCCHNDGNKINNRPDNLRWATRRENNNDKRSHGTLPLGANVPHAKLSDEVVLKIRSEKALENTPNTHLAKKYGVSDRMIGKIVRRESWTHI